MRFQLNFKSGKPVYLQLVDQVKAAAASGAVQPGEPLPSIRPLAEELRVNRNTVAKAYAELEHQRVIETIAGKGCFVRASASPFRKDVRLKLVAEEIDDAVVQAHHLQIAKADFLRLAEERFDAFQQQAGERRAAHDTHDTPTTPVIEIRDLVRRYGRTDAVNGLSLRVQPGRCYGFFGRNGAGKTTTIKCLLNLLRPTSGEARVFGLDPARHEVPVKSRLAYVPDNVAFYPWMTVRGTLDYFASFRAHWNRETERALLDQFRLDPRQKTSHLSKGQRTQLALITAVCPEPELLVLDEPTSGLDPIVRREFIQTIIGAYQEGEPGRRTVLVSTHLISEFEGLIDEFTIIEQGRAVLSLGGRRARERYQKIYARFATEPAALELAGARVLRRRRTRSRGRRQRERRRRLRSPARRARRRR